MTGHPPRLYRRSVLIGGATALIPGALAAGRRRGVEGPLFIGCQRSAAGGQSLVGFRSGALRPSFAVPLPDRGHDCAFHPRRPHGVVFARRAGTFAVVFDHQVGVALHRLDVAAGTHFYGHGTFSADGAVLFTTEQRIDSGEGLIGVRDAMTDYRLLGHLPAGGIGPHDVQRLPGGTLAVAVGGIRTHPDFGRAKLNLDTMRPCLGVVDPVSGIVLERIGLPARLHQVSIRHMDIAPDGRIALGMQYQGGKRDAVPLIGDWHGGDIRLFPAPEPVRRRMRHYVGSIRFDAGHRVIAASCPRGHAVTFWDAETGASLGLSRFPDACGLAPTDRPGVFAAVGMGAPVELDAAAPAVAPESLADLSATWDNHLVVVPSTA